MSDEKRGFTRVPFHIFATIEGQGEIIEGQVTDLSLKGLFVETQGVATLDGEVDVTLRMPGTKPPLEFLVRAVVARITPEGIGIKISEADIQSFTHLRNIVTMQAADPDRVLDELLPDKS